MELTQEQINIISSSILLSDVKTYIDSHKEKYEEFLKTYKSCV